MIALVPPGMAVFGSVFAISPKAWARDTVGVGDRLRAQFDLLNRTQHPWPFRKPFLNVAPDGTILLAIENVERTQAHADDNSIRWAWQIAHQAGLSQAEWEITVVASDQVTPYRQP